MAEIAPGLTAAAFEAVNAYGLAGSSLAFLQHSDTVTFKVTSGASTYLLRIHRPITEAMGGHGLDENAVRSELQWLEALNEQTDAPVQRPVRNLDGELVTRVKLDAAGETYHCTVLSWLEGQPYLRDLEREGMTAAAASREGRMRERHAAWREKAFLYRGKRERKRPESMAASIQADV
mgnify:CR=1 FL=1